MLEKKRQFLQNGTLAVDKQAELRLRLDQVSQKQLKNLEQKNIAKGRADNASQGSIRNDKESNPKQMR